MYYRLIPEVYLVPGETGAILTNVITGDIISINSETRKLIQDAENNIPFMDKVEVLQTLCDMGWMQEKDVPVFIEKIRFTNVFNKKRAWKFLPNVETLILQVTNKCSTSCKMNDCSESFCPICIRLKDAKKEELTAENWKLIINQLMPLHPKKIIITGGNPLLHNEFYDIYKYCRSKVDNVFVHINRVEDIEKLPEDTNILITLFDEKQIEQYKSAKHKNPNVIAMHEFTKINLESGINVNFSRPVITKKTFLRKCSMSEHFVRRMYDSCLTGKVTVLFDGSVVPCLGCNDKIIGNLRKEKMVDIVRKLYYDYWDKEVDTRVEKKCSKCEYRYNCSSCIKMNDDDCKYNVEDGVWKS